MRKIGKKSNRIPDGFDEVIYLESNPDVADAVATGIFSSGREHYEKYGFREDRRIGRNLRSPPPSWEILPESLQHYSRRIRTLAGLNLSEAEGVEIGPLVAPLVTPQEGKITYVDYTTTQELRKKYAKESDIDISKIAKIDAVWGDKSLRDCLNLRKFDYVVASHVIEHVPDLITWLKEVSTVLKTGGTLRLAVPDRRHSFDYLRYESRLHDVLDAYINKSRRPASRQILEHYELTREVDRVGSWRKDFEPSGLKRKYPAGMGIKLAKSAVKRNEYHDVHCWVFTPQSFVNLLAKIADANLLSFGCDNFIPTQINELEFYVHMSVCKDKTKRIKSWKRAARIAVSGPSFAPDMQALDAEAPLNQEIMQ